MATCEHLEQYPLTGSEEPATECPDCVAIGSGWVHLRRCLGCGHVGCCDSSPNRHATAHYRADGHPVMASAQAGESWRWCFVDEVTG